MNEKNAEKQDSVLSETEKLDDQALDYLKKNGKTTVPTLFDALRAKNSAVTDTEVANLVWRLAERGQVDLEDVPPQVRSFGEYLGLWERNVGLYVSVAVALITVLVIYTIPYQLPLVALRWTLGSVFVLFIPGYVTTEAFLPKSREWSGVERFGLSVGLSLILAMMVGLILDYTPFGIRLNPIVISLTIFTVGLSLAALVRRFIRLIPDDKKGHSSLR